ncbi:hypothetical protein ACHAXR_006424 [Thalassiosira sp. AJA248-18]
MTLTAKKLEDDDDGDCPVVQGILLEECLPAPSAPPAPDSPSAPSAPEPADNSTSTAAPEFAATSTQKSDIHGAAYFKNPTADMLQQAKHMQSFAGGVLFLMVPTNFGGKFTVPKSIKAGHVLSGDKMDLSRADFVHPVTKINVCEILGGLEVIVPRGVRVQMKGIGILGGFEYKSRGQTVGAEQDAPLVVLSGFSLLGGVEVKVNTSVPPVRVVH